MRHVLVFVFLASIAVGQVNSAGLIGGATNRTAISLDGTWNTIVDPYESGIGSRYYLNWKLKSKSDLLEYDFDRSPKLHVPGDWNMQRESLLFYEGPLWYQRNFAYQKQQHARTFLYFGAANYQARVWLNRKKLGEHIGGMLKSRYSKRRWLKIQPTRFRNC
jgi:beta-glucuronidase